VKLSLIVAADEKDLIGRGDALPWHLPEDLRRFKQLTTGHTLVAGRRTHDSIVARLGHALPGRFTVVATRGGLTGVDGAVFVPNVETALRVATDVEGFAGGDEVFVIGGSEIYRQTLSTITKVYLTRVHTVADGDVRMPEGWLDGFAQVDADRRPEFSFETYERPCTD
jgi:dihydrofolate reductase